MAFRDSVTAEAELSLIGVWIHDPLDAQGTSASFPYGRAARDTALDAMGSGSYYAGRAFPVIDYGEHEGETVGVTIEVPHGPDYRATIERLERFARAKTSLWFRDNRGRSLLGTMAGFKHADQPWGSSVSFTVERVHRDVAEVSA